MTREQHVWFAVSAARSALTVDGQGPPRQRTRRPNTGAVSGVAHADAIGRRGHDEPYLHPAGQRPQQMVGAKVTARIERPRHFARNGQ
jgi:hypothetical protein